VIRYYFNGRQGINTTMAFMRGPSFLGTNWDILGYFVLCCIGGGFIRYRSDRQIGISSNKRKSRKKEKL